MDALAITITALAFLSIFTLAAWRMRKSAASTRNKVSRGREPLGPAAGDTRTVAQDTFARHVERGIS
jgi:hypothetical protein